MKAVATGFGALAIVVGLMMMGGSAGDCDGHCMEQANTIGEMLIMAASGLAIFASGVFFMLVGHQD